MPPVDRAAALSDSLGYSFAHSALLHEALTHRSAGSVNNERLEFLGDALLNTVIGIELYQRRPDAPEGDLSRLRAALVRQESLATIAREHDLGGALTLGEGERKSGGHRRDSILADACEAVIGAVYLDSDFDTVHRFIVGLYGDRLEHLPSADQLKDPKTRLQEYLQCRRRSPPEYEVIGSSGAEHERRFVVRCRIGAFDIEREATGSSRRKAEQQAAQACLDALDPA